MLLSLLQMRCGMRFLWSRKGFVIASWLLVIGTLADLLTTHYGLNLVVMLGGQMGDGEMNPIVRYMIQNWGMISVYCVKISYTILLIWIARRLKYLRAINLTAGVWYIAVAMHNLNSVSTLLRSI